MALSSDPSVAYNSEGNILASGSLAANTTSSGNIVDFSSAVGGWVGFKDTGGGTVAATNGLQIQVFPQTFTGTYDTVALMTQVITTVVSTASYQSILLPTGKYSIAVKNLDASNAITVSITSNPIT